MGGSYTFLIITFNKQGAIMKKFNILLGQVNM